MTGKADEQKPRARRARARTAGAAWAAEASGEESASLAQRLKAKEAEFVAICLAQANAIEERQRVLADLKQIHSRALEVLAGLKSEGASKDAAHVALFAARCGLLIEELEKPISALASAEWRQLANE